MVFVKTRHFIYLSVAPFLEMEITLEGEFHNEGLTACIRQCG